ncbi:peptidoglycan-binding domain-containing protein [Microcoleus sp. FACHB-672]|uniref:peptidoglycan-binding domain-containing protein n=1 Tax=Microcoleus sp. FACHB-672 TaxID=2692825 RepID=UPI001682F0DC|nr:peptidoglycan-binding domain-containing protein [Microcoleus sp. FACHB-672]MBD2043231.1 peptidoglycan-binding protein [Microcoleus sp. FACHB-672]
MALKLGDRSSEVEQLKRQLETLGYSIGRINAEFDARTDDIVKAFQEEAGLKIDGIVGPTTSGALSQATQGMVSIPNIGGALEQFAAPASRPEANISGDFIEGRWPAWRVIVSGLNGRSGPGMEYPAEYVFPNGQTFSPHQDYTHPIQFDWVGKPWMVVNERGAAFFVRANRKFIEPV